MIVAKDLMAAIKDFRHWYLKDILQIIKQRSKLRELVEDGVGILKVGGTYICYA